MTAPTVLASSVLFSSQDASVLLLDIPRSLEEAQVSPGQPPRWRLYSHPPPLEPFRLPEPKEEDVSTFTQQTPAAQVADLMTSAAVRQALDELKRYSGPFCLPRIVPREALCSPEQHHHHHQHLPPPEGSHFLHGTVQSTTQAFLDAAPRFRLILLDPPWPNASARRKRKSGGYGTAASLAEVRRLLSGIPVPARLAHDGLVAVWITNKPSILELLTCPARGILAGWGLELVAEWTWVKIAASGEPLFALDSRWRRPWERLLIAKRCGSPTPAGLRPKVVVAVPDAHSRKPNLRRQFEDVLGRGYPALEVFARSLTAGWWSWGDEVLSFQGGQHWTDDPSIADEHQVIRDHHT